MALSKNDLKLIGKLVADSIKAAAPAPEPSKKGGKKAKAEPKPVTAEVGKFKGKPAIQFSIDGKVVGGFCGAKAKALLALGEKALLKALRTVAGE